MKIAILETTNTDPFIGAIKEVALRFPEAEITALCGGDTSEALCSGSVSKASVLHISNSAFGLIASFLKIVSILRKGGFDMVAITSETGLPTRSHQFSTLALLLSGARRKAVLYESGKVLDIGIGSWFIDALFILIDLIKLIAVDIVVIPILVISLAGVIIVDLVGTVTGISKGSSGRRL